MASALTCRVVTPSGVRWEGMAQAITSKNEAGEFSILPGHTNFISLIKQGVTVKPVRGSSGAGEAKTIDATDGVLICRDDVVEVYVSDKNGSGTAPAQVQGPTSTLPIETEETTEEGAET